nr:Ca2+ sensor (EF-Hand superfamily) [Ipomoea batatas]
MDHLQQIAKAYYLAGSPELQTGVQELFNTLDSDGDGHIEKDEFICVLTQDSVDEERDVEKCRNLFDELDIDGNGTLDFWEVMTLFYIHMSKRPSCDGCGKFIPATFFTCVECHSDPHHTQFDLCIGCYENRRSSGHKHQGKPATFLDNYTLLDVKRSSSSGLSFNTNADDVNNNISQASISSTQHVGSASASAPANPPNSNTAVVPATNKYEKWKVLLQAVQIALAMGNVAACTVM